MYSISDAKEELNCLLRDLVAEAHFDKVLNGSLSIKDWYLNHITSMPENIQYSCGCCRIVFWDEDYCDYVFKIDFSTEPYKYSANEAKLYQRAIEAKIEQFFAWCAPVYDNGIIQIYAMAYCDVDEKQISEQIYAHFLPRICDELGYDPDNLTSKEQSDVYNALGYSGDIDNVEHFLYDFYGSIDMSRLFSFLAKHCVNDIHAGNIGWLDGAIVLTDYAGYGHNLEV